MNYSSYQQDIFNWIKTGHGDAVVEAVAGSGKTTTLEEASKQIESGPILFAAFNVAIVKELKIRLGTAAECKTINGIGHGALMRHLGGNLRIEEFKYRDIINDVTSNLPQGKDHNEIRSSLGQLVSFIQTCLTATPTDDDFNTLVEHYTIELNHGMDLPWYYATAREVLKIGDDMAYNTKTIAFNDQIWLPNLWNITPKQYPFVFVDEAQDLSRGKLELILRSRGRGGRMLFVGDSRQCQPAGTKIALAAPDNRWQTHPVRYARIEDIRPGDRVVSYSPSDTAFLQAGRIVTAVEKRPYTGWLFKTTTQDHTSYYTPNHKCYANFSPLRNQYAVYLILRDNHFRIGVSKMDYGDAGSGPIARGRAERAEALWILNTYPTSSEARIAEAVISALHNIPQLLFQAPNRDQKTQSFLDSAWQQIDDNTKNGIHCLEYFHRSFEYPLATPATGEYTSFKRPMIVHACNLLDGATMLPYLGKGHGHTKLTDWQSIQVTRELYQGYVYSLAVEKEHLYIADGLVTHNSIYGFSGADPAAWQTIIERTKATILPLSICYRCPTSHLEHARQIVPQIEGRPDAPVGTIKDITLDQLASEVQSNDLIVCRTTAPLIRECLKLIGQRIPARVMGRDIGKQMISLAKTVSKAHYSIKDFPTGLRTVTDKKIEDILHRKNAESLTQALNDRHDGLLACWEGIKPTSYESFFYGIEELFSDKESVVTLATVHRVKGLQRHRVFILHPELLGKWGRQDWQKEQERNLKYVALTRSMDTLYFVREESE